MKDNNKRIIAVTVTYNRSSTLCRCISALLSQFRPVDRILIVDNCSRPEEQERIRDIAGSDSRIEVIWLSENLGGAGGFEAGMCAAGADKEGFDYIWIMDDDAYPRPDCLKRLLEAEATLEEASRRESKKEIGFLAPMIFGVDLKQYQLYHHKYLRGMALQDVQAVDSIEGLDSLKEIEANAFVGPIISKAAVDKVGVADGGMFIYGDDTEYTYRVTRLFSGYLVRDAVIDHQDPPMTSNFLQPEAWWKEYYKNRNRFFIISEFKTGVNRIIGYFALVIPIVAQIPSALLKPKYRGFHGLRVRMLLKAIGDGLFNRRGKRIDPGEYSSLIEAYKSKR